MCAYIYMYVCNSNIVIILLHMLTPHLLKLLTPIEGVKILPFSPLLSPFFAKPLNLVM